MKMEIQSAMYQQPENFRHENESVNTTIRLPSKNKSASQSFSISAIQKKFPQSPRDNVSEV